MIQCPLAVRRRSDAASSLVTFSSSFPILAARCKNWVASSPSKDIRSLLVYLRVASGHIDDTGVCAASCGAFRSDSFASLLSGWGICIAKRAQFTADFRSLLFTWASRLMTLRMSE